MKLRILLIIRSLKQLDSRSMLFGLCWRLVVTAIINVIIVGTLIYTFLDP